MSFESGTRVLGLTAETTRGTKETIVYDKEFYDATAISPTREINKIGNLAGRKTRYANNYVGAESGTATALFELKGSGANATEPKIGEILRAGGFAFTPNVDGVLSGYVLDGTLPCSSLSFASTVYGCGSTPTGITSTLVGAVPAITITGDSVGGAVKFSSELTGGLEIGAADEDSLFAVAGTDGTKGLKFEGGIYTIGGTQIAIKSFEVSTSPEVGGELDPTKGNGSFYKYHHIKDLRGRSLTLEYTKPLKSVKDFDAEFSAETIYNEVVLDLTSESGENAKLIFTLPQANDWSDQDSDSYVTQSVTFDIDNAIIVFDVV